MKAFDPRIEWRDPATLTPYSNNAKTHPTEQIDKIAASIASFGFDQPIVVDTDGVIIKGHGRREASLRLGLDQVPVLGFVYIILKIVACLFLMIWIRATLPRFRYDQLMGFGWKVLLPIAVLNFLITAVLIVMAEEGTLAPLINSVKLFFSG